GATELEEAGLDGEDEVVAAQWPAVAVEQAVPDVGGGDDVDGALQRVHAGVLGLLDPGQLLLRLDAALAAVEVRAGGDVDVGGAEEVGVEGGEVVVDVDG